MESSESADSGQSLITPGYPLKGVRRIYRLRLCRRPLGSTFRCLGGLELWVDFGSRWETLGSLWEPSGQPGALDDFFGKHWAVPGCLWGVFGSLVAP